MKFIIKHEIKGRIRISLARKFHTVREADVLEQYLLGLDGVTAAKVYEQDCAAMRLSIIRRIGRRYSYR